MGRWDVSQKRIMREFPAIANEIRDWPLEHLWQWRGGGGGGEMGEVQKKYLRKGKLKEKSHLTPNNPK